MFVTICSFDGLPFFVGYSFSFHVYEQSITHSFDIVRYEYKGLNETKMYNEEKANHGEENGFNLKIELLND
ncbi:hypothetical protein BLOT_015929 [Blomia tropicalis]|nr:hypothetical protein BLOT_015929 [Blomia tropicalis]